MKIKLTLLMSLMTLIAGAQNFYSNYNNSDYFGVYYSILPYNTYVYDYRIPIEHKHNNEYQDITYTTTEKNGKKLVIKKEYNKDSLLTQYGSSYDNEIFKPIKKYEYDKNGRLVLINSYFRDKFSGAVKYSYNNEGKILSVIKYNKKNEISYQSINEYNESGCISKYLRVKGDNKTQFYTIYEYYDKCDRKRTTTYSGKGKLNNTVSYACKDEGEILEKKKNEKQMCNWDEITPEYLIKVTQAFDDKGRTSRIIRKYDIKDTVLVEYISYDYKNQISYKSESNKVYSKKLEKYISQMAYQKYYKNGKENSSYSYKYSNGKVSEQITIKKGKVINQYNMIYEGDKLIERTVFRKGKQVSKEQNKFENDLLVETKRYSKLNKLEKVYKISYGKKLTN